MFAYCSTRFDLWRCGIHGLSFLLQIIPSQIGRSQIGAYGLELVENLPGLFVGDLAGEQAGYDLGEGALHGCGVAQRGGFEPSLPDALGGFFGLARLLRVVEIAVAPPPAGGALAAGIWVHPVLA
jgi:hypothetical protein